MAGGRERDTLEITCPCCGTIMTVDPETGAILLETRPKKAASFEEAVAAEKQKEKQRASAFQKAFHAVETEKDVLEKKLKEAMKKAAEEKDKPPPLRPIDLD